MGNYGVLIIHKMDYTKCNALNVVQYVHAALENED
jgi:hypothetical protein